MKKPHPGTLSFGDNNHTGIRLIDVGISALKSQVGARLFDRFVEQERKELEAFRSFFLSR